MATSGPGATNLITGIATAYMDSIPLVAITGQVNQWCLGRDVFQEADITGACESFVKHSYLVKNAADLPRVFKEAFHIAGTGPGADRRAYGCAAAAGQNVELSGKGGNPGLQAPHAGPCAANQKGAGRDP